SQFPRDDVVAPALVFLARLINQELQGTISTKAVPDFEKAAISSQFVPESLLSAMWYQFADGIEKGLRYRACKVCGAWFALAPGVARKNRVFCSDACKSRDYREKQDRARQMKAAGKSFQVIAKELETEVETVKGWITGRRK